MLSFRPGELACFVNGVQVQSAPAGGDRSSWSPQHLVIGKEYGGGRECHGSQRGIDGPSISGSARRTPEVQIPPLNRYDWHDRPSPLARGLPTHAKNMQTAGKTGLLSPGEGW